MCDGDLPKNAGLSAVITEAASHIVDSFGLVSIGAPYMTLRPCRSLSEGRRAKLDDGMLGKVIVWQPPPSQVTPLLEKLVLLRLGSSQWLFAFSSSNSLVPHLFLGLPGGSTSDTGNHQTSERQPVFLMDLISKVHFSNTNAEYVDALYGALSAPHTEALFSLKQLELSEKEAELTAQRLKVNSFLGCTFRNTHGCTAA
eukprot:6174302-Pleurochrysis_carterae.AAC.2